MVLMGNPEKKMYPLLAYTYLFTRIYIFMYIRTIRCTLNAKIVKEEKGFTYYYFLLLLKVFVLIIAKALNQRLICFFTRFQLSQLAVSCDMLLRAERTSLDCVMSAIPWNIHKLQPCPFAYIAI